MQAWLSRPAAASTAFTPRLLAASFFVLALCGSAAVARAQAPPLTGTPDLGRPPSADIPIIYNDHTVYAKPDILKQSRVLAALYKDGQLYVPLRSMFEQMGATVSASPDGKTFTATKTGSTASVTLGKDEVVINGETRPLDVPPMLYRGVVLVPVRVLSEALGAYVQWVPARRIVVVRYIPVAPPAPPAPTPAPPVPVPVVPPAPTPSPSPTPSPTPYHGFVQGAVGSHHNFNEFSAGNDCPEAYVLTGVYAFKNSPLAIKVDYRQDVYLTSDNLTNAIDNHYTQFSTIDGGASFVPVFLARQSTLEARVDLQIANPHIYAGLSYLHTANNFGYPHLNAVGAGLEKLPDLRPGISFAGSAFYYPSASGDYTVNDPASPNAGKTYRQQYRIITYDVGVTLVFAHSPVYLHGGINGTHYGARQNAPVGQTHDGPYIGLGVKL